jgi:hypothetical protein
MNSKGHSRLLIERVFNRFPNYRTIRIGFISVDAMEHVNTELDKKTEIDCYNLLAEIEEGLKQWRRDQRPILTSLEH